MFDLLHILYDVNPNEVSFERPENAKTSRYILSKLTRCVITCLQGFGAKLALLKMKVNSKDPKGGEKIFIYIYRLIYYNSI